MRTFVVWLLLGAAAAAAAQDPEDPPESCERSKLRIGLEWFLNADHMPLVLAKRLGYFDDAGLDVELLEPSDHWEAENELAEGRIDVAVTEPVHLAKDAGSGAAILGFARFFHTDGGVMYFDPTIRRPRDMCGKTIQYPGAPGPGGPAIVQTMVEHDGGTCDIATYKKVNFGFDHVGALKTNQADLATLIFSNFEIPAAIASGHPEAKYFSLKENGVPDFCQLVLITHRDKFHTLRPRLRRFVLALRKAVTLIHRDPESAIALFQLQSPPASDITNASIYATLPMFPNDFSMALDYYDILVTWLQHTHQLSPDDTPVPPSLYWTNDIVLP